MSTAATTATPAYDPAEDELVRVTRHRIARRGLERIRQRAFVLCALGVAAAAAISAIVVTAGPRYDPTSILLFLALYGVVSRVTFETGTGYAVPTELVLVPMLFALPLGVVPAVVGAGFVVGFARESWARKGIVRVLPVFASAAHAFGPVLVLALAHGLPLRWAAWPVYLAALAAQCAFDLANGLLSDLGSPISFRETLRSARVAYAVDAALAPIGLAVAFATRPHPELVVLVLPLAFLLRQFSGERKRRIDHALELSDAYRGTAFLLGDVVEADDEYTGDHSRHVVDLVLGVADEIPLDGADRRVAEFVALLHDVGKIKIPDEIIAKPGPLTDEERAIIETHTIEGERLLEQVGGLLGHVGRVVRSCHEHWDGSGYPDGLVGEEIPLVARIVSACDAFSAMTTNRPYRAARTEAEALAEMRRCSGTQFDPGVVDALCRAVG